MRDQIQKDFVELSNQGLRTLGIAYKKKSSKALINKSDGTGMTLSRFLTLFDPPKPNIAETIASLKKGKSA
ncbi:MAG: hypothetical protein A2W19_07800 [Spirochaetes bacterium RBG_16_49_21]|nr:MAG: hypothetical protein A2W19_07800 [Spirochaetes bacterium RBG_16_49_21]